MGRRCLDQGAGQLGNAGIMRQQQEAVVLALGIDGRAQRCGLCQIEFGHCHRAQVSVERCKALACAFGI